MMLLLLDPSRKYIPDRSNELGRSACELRSASLLHAVPSVRQTPFSNTAFVRQPHFQSKAPNPAWVLGFSHQAGRQQLARPFMS